MRFHVWKGASLMEDWLHRGFEPRRVFLCLGVHLLAMIASLSFMVTLRISPHATAASESVWLGLGAVIQATLSSVAQARWLGVPPRNLKLLWVVVSVATATAWWVLAQRTSWPRWPLVPHLPIVLMGSVFSFPLAMVLGWSGRPGGGTGVLVACASMVMVATLIDLTRPLSLLRLLAQPHGMLFIRDIMMVLCTAPSDSSKVVSRAEL